MNSDHLSVEVYGDSFLFPSNEFDTMFETELSSLFNSGLYTNEFDIAGVCESTDFVESITRPAEPDELDQYLGPKLSSDPISDIDQNLLAINSLPVYNSEKNKKVKGHKKPISLSSSVGVGVPQRSLKPCHKIEIVCDLEEKYRPRYKSDYFSQNGTTRKPRYVTDRDGNHYITLKIPRGVRGKIRVDWVTVPDENGNRYVMPYRFQSSNEQAEILDCNPIYEDIVDGMAEIIKLYLVLIKTKQDALKSLQPLQPFQPWKDVLGVIDKHTPEKMLKLTPKKLIEKYQLGKSQLAFTLCTLSTDGQSYLPIWDTTAFSTVLEEFGDNSTIKTVACPRCSCPISFNDDGVVMQEIITNKRKTLQIKAEKPNAIKKQKRLPAPLYCVT